MVYGDTSQDGRWYAGDPSRQSIGDFGIKPFPNQIGNGSPRFLFPLANPFHFAGNDVIDASALFAGAITPTVGITAFGGAGDDLIIGSQTGDHLAGGSGNDTILGQRGADLIYGDSGVNVDVITRALTIPTVNASTTRNADRLAAAGDDVLWGEGAGTVGTTGFDDVIFGDHGRVTQLVADPNQPSPLLQRIQTTGFIRDIATVRPGLGGNDVIHGNAGRDRIFGGNGNDTITGDGDPNAIFGDHGHLQYIAGTTDVTTLHLAESIDFAYGGIDTITANGGDDFIFGGARGDTIDAGDGQNIVFGDHGRITGVENSVFNRPIGTGVPVRDDYQIPVLALVEALVPAGEQRRRRHHPHRHRPRQDLRRRRQRHDRRQQRRDGRQPGPQQHRLRRLRLRRLPHQRHPGRRLRRSRGGRPQRQRARHRPRLVDRATASAATTRSPPASPPTTSSSAARGNDTITLRRRAATSSSATTRG